MTRVRKCAAVLLASIVAVSLASCSLLSPTPTPRISDLTGTWKADDSNAVLTLKDDMTFVAKNVPAGYIYISLPYGVSSTEKISTSGKWSMDHAGGVAGYDVVNLVFTVDGAQSHNELNLRFSGGRLDHIYLTEGDPDLGNFLNFNQ